MTAKKNPLKGKITKLEAATSKERIFVVNGVKFFAVVTKTGYRVLSACHESKKTLESASRALILKGWDVKVRRSRDDKSLFLLEAREKTPSGPWIDEEPKPAPPTTSEIMTRMEEAELKSESLEEQGPKDKLIEVKKDPVE